MGVTLLPVLCLICWHLLSIDSGLRTDGSRATKGIMESEKAETYRKIRIFQHLGLLSGRWFVRKRVRNLTRNLTRNLRETSREISEVSRRFCGGIVGGFCGWQGSAEN